MRLQSPLEALMLRLKTSRDMRRHRTQDDLRRCGLERLEVR